MKKPTPWIPTLRVFKVDKMDYLVLCKLNGVGPRTIDRRISLASAQYAAITANQEINNIIEESKHV